MPTVTNSEGKEVTSILDMSDEEMSNLDPSKFVFDSSGSESEESGEGKSEVTENQDDNVTEEEEEEEGTTETKVSTEADTEETTTEETEETDETGSDDKEGSEKGTEEKSKDTNSGNKATKTDKKEVTTQSEVDTKANKADDVAKAKDASKEPDYKTLYEQVVAPFKANGREMQIESVEDVRALMQMGANYNKKMQALKPNLKLMKLLENNNLLDEGKLSFLIDLDKRNPEAINKLVKDSGIDPMDLSTDKADGYKPSTYKVDDRQIDLDNVLTELEGSEHYTRTLDVVANKWDSSSRNVIAESPQIIKIINDHMESGIYDRITTEMERERVLGRLTGVSDLEAYRQVGDAIQARGGFADLGVKTDKQASQPVQKVSTAAAVIVQPKPKKADEADTRNDKKRAASPSKATVSTPAKADFNPLALSDEEFAKQFNAKFK